MLFYRIEDKKRYGPYKNGYDAIRQWLKGKSSSSPRHPVPQDDSLLMESLRKDGFSEPYFPRFRFGFKSIEQLRAWFYDDKILLALEALGFKLAIYDADVLVGSSQAVILDEEHVLQNRKEVRKLSSLCLTKPQKSATI